MTEQSALKLIEDHEWVSSVWGLTEVVEGVAAAAKAGKNTLALVYGDLDADYGPLMDGLMTLGFSRSLVDTDDGHKVLTVNWS